MRFAEGDLIAGRNFVTDIKLAAIALWGGAMIVRRLNTVISYDGKPLQLS